MDTKERLVKHLKKLRKNEFYFLLVKIIFITTFLILTPIIIYEKIQERDFITIVLLLIAEMVLILVAIMLLKTAFEIFKIENSSIYQCINNPNAVTEIVITPNKIVFEIKGMEDETLFLKKSHFRSEMLSYIKEVFGENKIVDNY